MAGFAEDCDHFGERRFDIDRFDVGARNHHVRYPHVAELQDGAQHGPLVGGKRCACRLIGGDGVFDLGPRRTVLAQPKCAQKCSPKPGYYVRLLARGVCRRALGTSTLVVAHSAEAAA